MDRQIINEKLESLRRSIDLIEEKCSDSQDKLQANLDLQDIVVLHLTRAIQLCVDIGAQFITASDEKAPATMGATFETLEKMNILDSGISISMKKANGFRKVAVHGYDKLNLVIVYAIATDKPQDFKQFAKVIAGHQL